MAASTAATVLLVNVILTIWAASTFRDTLEGGIGTAYEGSCDVVNSWARWLHIAINALSSLLLSASNYTMQCLSSPTRKEIDRAHAKQDWLDIGVAGVRNLKKIRWHRVALWWALGLSSVPIHLLYNSAVFKTLNANSYQILTVSPDFLQGGGFNPNQSISSNYYDGGNLSYYSTQINTMQSIFVFDNGGPSNTTAFDNLTNSDCIAAYSTSFVTGRSNILAVTEASTGFNDSVYIYMDETPDLETGSSPSYTWICLDTDGYDSDDCDTSKARSNASKWTLGSKKIAYCLSEKVPEYCKFQFSVTILAAVIICNLCKSVSMFLTLWRQRDATLVTVGDAVASFLEFPDETTTGRCMMGKVDVNKGPLAWKHGKKVLPITYRKPLRRRWFSAASPKRWAFCMTTCIVALITTGALLGAGISNISTGESIWSLGFGAVNSATLLPLPSGWSDTGASGLVGAVLLANLPQAVVSFLYLMYNGLYTCMLLSHEWSRYAVQRRHLRVSTPKAAQRSTYFLQLPYTYGLPLLIASGTLHWLISQSIFLARVTVYQDPGFGDPGVATDTSQIGYSCPPIICCIILGSVMLMVALGQGFRKFASGIPVASSCSVAISTACHRPESDIDAASMPVLWGTVDDGKTDEVGHVSFSSQDVGDLIPGRMYAGGMGEESRHRAVYHYE